MNRFKVGDTIVAKRSAFGLAQGERYTVTGIASASGEMSHIKWVFIEGYRHPHSYDGSFREDEFEPATEPKFKAGDRVRLKRDAGYIGTVKGRSSDEYRNEPAYTVNMDWYGNPETTTTWYESELEPVAVAQQPQPLRIQPGKFYITRDGRKVGPMLIWDKESEWPWSDHVDSGSGIWRGDGSVFDRCEDDDDLIAEWTEPQSTKEILDELEAWVAEQDAIEAAGKGSTAGFTVPLCAYDDEPGRYAAELGRAYADGYAAGLRAAA